MGETEEAGMIMETMEYTLNDWTIATNYLRILERMCDCLYEESHQRAYDLLRDNVLDAEIREVLDRLREEIAAIKGIRDEIWSHLRQ